MCEIGTQPNAKPIVFIWNYSDKTTEEKYHYRVATLITKIYKFLKQHFYQ